MSDVLNHNPVFEMNQVHFSYDGRDEALSNIDLTIWRGEKIAVLGSNGSGKSTLLKILNGLYFPTSGTVHAFGRPLTERALLDDTFGFEFRRRVSLIFQDSDVQLFLPTVYDEVAFAPLQLDLPLEEIRRRVDDALAALHITRLRDRAPHRLSGGEKRKVAIAAVYSLQPEVWLMDEPTSGLDPRTQAWLIDFVCEQAAGGKTIITATHDLNIVRDIADRVIVFGEDHRIAAEGTPDEILEDKYLLLACNLVHAHRHIHGDEAHCHHHLHTGHHHNGQLIDYS